MNRRRWVAVAVVLMVVMQAKMGESQDIRGSITGRITDRSGAVVIGAGVNATNLATNVTLSTLSNDVGNYRIDFLNPGSYQIKISVAGFKTTTRSVEVRTNDRLQLDMQLELGEVTETISVEDQTPLLETTNADRGLVIDNRRIETIPLAMGNPTFLLTLAPGANPGTSRGSFRADSPGGDAASGFSFHGSSWYSTGFTLDGIDNNLAWNLQAGNSQPPTDAVQEFKVTQSYDASGGNSAGTSVDVMLKSGTQDLHGTAYGFYRDSSLEANSFLNNRSGIPIPQSKYRRLGFSVTGPVYIPKLYNGRDRTFFAYTFEDAHLADFPSIGVQTVPTEEQLRGDFSKLLALGPQYQIYDPLTTVAAAGGLFRRSPFPNNLIPENRIHPIAKQLAQYYPKPNLAGGADGSGNFQPSAILPDDWFQSFFRVDHNFNSSHRMFVQHGILDRLSQFRDDFGTLATGNQSEMRRQNFGLDYVYAARPNLLFNFKYGVTRLGVADFPKSHVRHKSGGFDISTLGLSPAFVSQLDLTNSTLPASFITGYSPLFDGTNLREIGVDVQVAKADVSYTRGNHDLKMGFIFRSSRSNQKQLAGTMPRYDYGTLFTNGPLNTSAAAPIGQGLAAFLLGQPTGGSIQRRDNFAAANPDYSLFVQENWRVNSRLTLNFGLRFEYVLPVTERYNRSVRGFEDGVSNPIEAQARAAYALNPIPEISPNDFRVRGGYNFVGVGGQPRGIHDTIGGSIAPRFGFAYRLGNNSVLRGGYGIFLLPRALTSNDESFVPRLDGFSRTTDLIPSFDNGLTYVADIQNPFPTGLLQPLRAEGGLSTNLGQNITFFNTDNLKSPYMQRWSFAIQSTLPFNNVVEVGYVGSRAVRLVGDPLQRQSREFNNLPEQYLSTATVRDQANINYLTQAVANPFAGLAPGSSLNTPVTTRQQLLKPFPQFSGVRTNQANEGYSWYHGLEAKVEKRFAQGVSYILSYVWSKNMEALQRLNLVDPFLHEIISDTDRTHLLSLTAIWEMPFGKGKRFGSQLPSGVSKTISGWEVSSVWHAMSGYPLTFSGDVFTTGSLEDLVLPRSQRTAERWFNTEAGLERNPSGQPEFHKRTFPLRFSTLRSDGYNFWDIGITKTTLITERVNIRFFAQFLNAFNNTSFGSINTTPSSGSFGRVNVENGYPRRIQFGLKLNF